MSPAPAGDSTLAQKIDHLFGVILRPDRNQYSNDEVARQCRDRSGETFSATYLWQLRTGRRDNPTKRHLEALADFFGVPIAYFFDDESSTRIAEELTLLGALRDGAVRRIALRAVTLSPQGLDTVSDMIEAISRRESGASDDRAGETGAG